MSRRIILAWVILAASGLPSAWAQRPFASDLIPKRTSLERLGLERQFMAVVPVVGDERVLGISIAPGLLFAQTNRGYFHAFDSESGQFLWTARLGEASGRSRPASANSFEVFVTNMNKLYALDRKTGLEVWSQVLGDLPSSSTACDEDRVMVGLVNGKVYAYGLTVKDKEKKNTLISDRPVDLWNWQTGGPVETRPLPMTKIVAFGSDDGKVYVALSAERVMLYRFATGGAIGAGMGTLGTRLLLVPSADRNLYGLDVLTANVRWTYPSGAAIDQEPMVADQDIFVVNKEGLLTSLDPDNGSPRWTNSTQGGHLLAVGPKRVYLESHDGDLFIVDRATGQIVADPQATLKRVGLNLRGFEFGWTNRLNDRMYFATKGGMIICLRELGQTKPRMLRDPKELPFGYIPREGLLKELNPKRTEEPPPTEEKPPAEGEAPAGAEVPK